MERTTKKIPDLKSKILTNYGFEYREKDTIENLDEPYWVKDYVCIYTKKVGFGEGFYVGIGFEFKGKYYISYARKVQTFSEVKEIYAAITGEKLTRKK